MIQENLLFQSGQHVAYPILRTFDADYTYADIEEKLQHYSMIIGSHGNLQGKKVGLLVPSILDYLALAMAVNQAGGTIIPISWQLRKDDLSGILDFLTPHIIFTINTVNEYPFGDVIRGWLESKGLKTTIYRSNDCKDWQSEIIGTIELPTEPGQTTYIVCTSGSTGVPKGIMINQAAAEFQMSYFQVAMNLQPFDRLLLISPATSAFGMTNLFLGLKSKTQIIFPETFEFARIIQLMKEKRCNKVLTTPSIFKALLTLAASVPGVLDNLEMCGFGGEMITPDFVDLLKQKLPHTQPMGLYGISEMGGTMYTDLRGTMEWTVFDERIEWKISGEQPEGELLMRSPGIFSGYYKRPNLTAETLGAEGWYATGDLARLNENDKLEIIGRKKDMIKKGGQQIIPGEIEEVLQQHPNVKQAVVVGMPHRIFGEQVVAFIVPNGNLDMQNLHSFCMERIARYKIPEQFEVIDQIPISQGKADKITLKNRLLTK